MTLLPLLLLLFTVLAPAVAQTKEEILQPNYLYRLEQDKPDEYFGSGFTADARYAEGKGDEVPSSPTRFSSTTSHY